MLKAIQNKKKHNNIVQLGNYMLNVFERKMFKSKLRSYPVVLDIVPTLLCNIDCIFCIEYEVGGKKHLTIDTFNQIAKKIFPYSNQVNFCSGGEPFLNKNMMEFLTICKNYNINNSITTNGMLLTEDICESIVRDSNVINISFSFDGANKETVECIRRGVDYDIVVEKIRMLTGMKKKYIKDNPNLSIRCAVMKRNIEELPDLIRFSKEWGINQVIVDYLNVNEKMDKEESLYYHPGIVKEVFRESANIAKSEGIQLDLPPSMTEEQSANGCSQCYYPWTFMKIDPDGSIRFCYKSWNNPIGNILNHEHFTSLWNSDHYRLIRKTVNTNKPYFKYCSMCTVRNGANQIRSHIKETGEQLDFYDFDRDFEKEYNLEIPQRIEPITKSLRGLNKR